MTNRKHLWIATLIAAFAAACTTESATTSDRIAALYGDDVLDGDCDLSQTGAREEAEALFPSATVTEVERDEAYGVPTWDVDLTTENGGSAEVELFVASCSLYEVESDDADVEFSPGDLVATSLADAIEAASAGRSDAVVHWELDREEDHDGAWVYDVTFEDDTEIAVSAATGEVLADDDDGMDDDDATDDDDGMDDDGLDDDDDGLDDDDDSLA